VFRHLVSFATASPVLLKIGSCFEMPGKEAAVGSFSEVVFSFNFRKDTPDAVLAAFSALAKPVPDDASWGPAPNLPPPVVEPSEDWEPDYADEGWPDPDPNEAEPWRHEWAPWLSVAMGIQTVPSAALVWSETKQWNFACRFSFQGLPERIYRFLSWLGPFIDDHGDPDRPRFVGHIHHEYAPRPHLLWCQNGRLTMEDLNPDDNWQWGLR
jgi:hypothetical protein